MPEMLSPGVFSSEIDASTIAPSVSNSICVFAGRFDRGPIGEYKLITTVDELISFYGKPNNSNYNDWYQAYNFLQYGNKLYISRVANVKDSIEPISGETMIKNIPQFNDDSLFADQNIINYIGRTNFSNAIIKEGVGSIYVPEESGLYISNIGEHLVLNDAFTIDFWIYIKSDDADTNDHIFIENSDYKLQYGIFENGTILSLSIDDTILSSSGHIIANSFNYGEWNHIALVREANSTFITPFVNGVSGTPFNNVTGDVGVIGGSWIFGFSKSAYDIDQTDVESIKYTKCYLDEIRITKDISRFTSDFDPSYSTHMSLDI